MTMAFIRTLAFALAATVAAAHHAAADDAKVVKPMAVVELFTSQGCSSCPAADAFLGELAKRDDVIALSQHVAYWDYIGWKDPFALSEATDRQREYQRLFSLRYVYTPQMVINGIEQEVGSSRRQVLAKIEKAKTHAQVPIGLGPGAKGGVRIQIGGAPDGDAFKSDKNAVIWLIAFDKRHETKIPRGENGGRTLANVNVVRRIERIGDWNGDAATMWARTPERGEPGSDACAIVVQSTKSGRILGAAQMALAK